MTVCSVENPAKKATTVEFVRSSSRLMEQFAGYETKTDRRIPGILFEGAEE